MEPRILETAQERLAPHRTALLLIDMQNDFCVDGFATSKAGRPLDAARSIIPRLQRLLAAARDAGVLVCHVGFWTLPDHASDTGPWLAQRRRAAYASDKIAIAGTEGAEFIAELQPRDGEPVIHKHRYSAFKGTDLGYVLASRGIETVVVAGVSTNVCVESTARDSFESNYYVFVPGDGCASWDMSLHEATLRNVDARLGLVSSVEEITGIWTEAGDSA